MLLLPQVKKSIWIILLVGFVLYFPTIFNGFVWDDEEQILNNVAIHSISNLPSFFAGSTFNSGGAANGLSGLYFRPMMTTALSFIYTFFGPNAFVFHLFQIIIHVANSILVFLVLFYIFEKAKLNLALPVAISLIFLVHPINTEATVYLAAYQDVLFFFFGILAFYLILKKQNSKQIFYATLILLASFFAKETGAVFAAIIFTYLFLFEKQKVKPFVFGVVTGVAVYCLLRFGLAGVFLNKHGLTEISRISLAERLINIPSIIMYYLGNFFWPLNIAIDQQWVVKKINFQDLILPCVLIFLFIKNIKLNPRIFYFFGIWFILSLGFHLQIFPLDMTASDRWFYLSSVSLVALILISLDQSRFKKYLFPAVIIILFLLCLRTWLREFDWHDGLTLYSHDIKISQNAFDLENNYGVELFRIGDIAQAKIHFEKSTKLSPGWWTNWNNLGAVYEREGNLAVAESYYRRSIDNGNYYLAYENYGKILYRQNKIEELKNFLEKEALIRLPYNQVLRQLQYLLYNQKNF